MIVIIILQAQNIMVKTSFYCQYKDFNKSNQVKVAGDETLGFKVFKPKL